MTEILTALERLSKSVAKLSDTLARIRSKLVLPQEVDTAVRAIAEIYFGDVQPALVKIQRRAAFSDEIEWVVKTLLQLSSEPREKAAYLGQIKELKPYLQEAMIDAMKAHGTRRLISDQERSILTTLERMLPPTAASYDQVLQDIAAGTRTSWRGTGAELREVLREVMDHLAPDREVMAAEGFKLEEDQKRPTQKQKVRFILKARKRAVGTAEASLQTVEESIAILARSTYQRGSAGAHASTDATELRRLKNYVDALLVELLEISA